jgi:hypothetical protein
VTDLSAKIREHLLESGIPLQIQALSTIRSNGFAATASPYYFDEDEQKGREIDVVGYRYRRIQNRASGFHFFVQASLVVQCKKSDKHHWVFIIEPERSKGTRLRHELCYYSSPDIFVPPKEGFRNLVPFSVLRNVHHYFAHPVVGIAYSEAFKQTGKDTIFEALITAVKACEFDRLRRTQQGVKQCVYLYYPVVVFDGKLYIASAEGGFEPRPASHVLFRMAYRSRAYQGLYLVDVVTPDYLAVLCGETLREHGVICDTIETTRKQLAYPNQCADGPSGAD